MNGLLDPQATTVRRSRAVRGFARLTQGDLVHHEARHRLLDLIRAEPGVSGAALHARLGGGWSTLVYHLVVLTRTGLVTSVLDGRHRRYFPAEGIDPRQRAQIAALANPRTRIAFAILQDEPGMSQAELARRIGVAPPSATWHLQRLRAAGLLGQERDGREVHYFALAGGQGPSPTTHGRMPAAMASP